MGRLLRTPRALLGAPTSRTGLLTASLTGSFLASYNKPKDISAYVALTTVSIDVPLIQK